MQQMFLTEPEPNLPLLTNLDSKSSKKNVQLQQLPKIPPHNGLHQLDFNKQFFFSEIMKIIFTTFQLFCLAWPIGSNIKLMFWLKINRRFKILCGYLVPLWIALHASRNNCCNEQKFYYLRYHKIYISFQGHIIRCKFSLFTFY